MQVVRAFSMITLAAAGLATIGVLLAEDPAQAELTTLATPMTVRVFYLQGGPENVTGTFRGDPEDMKSVQTLLRAVYGVMDLKKSPAGDSLVFQAPQAIVDSSEALCRELKLLSEPAGTSQK